MYIQGQLVKLDKCFTHLGNVKGRVKCGERGQELRVGIRGKG